MINNTYPSSPNTSIFLLIVTCFICPSLTLYSLTDDWLSLPPLFFLLTDEERDPKTKEPAEVIVATPTINPQESQQQSTQEGAEGRVQPSSPDAANGLGSASNSPAEVPSQPAEVEVPSQPAEVEVPSQPAVEVSSPQPAALSDSTCAPSAFSPPELKVLVNDVTIVEGGSDSIATTTGGDTSGGPAQPEEKASVKSTYVRNEKAGDTSPIGLEDKDVEDSMHTNPRSEKTDELKRDRDVDNTLVSEVTADETSQINGTSPENAADIPVQTKLDPQGSNVSHDGSSSDPNAKAKATVVLASEDSSAFNETTTNEGRSSSSEDEDEQKTEAAEKLPTADVNEPSEKANESPANAEFTAATASTTAGGMPSLKYQSLQSAANGSEWPGAGWPQAPASGRPAEVIIETPTINSQESQQQSTQRAEDWVQPSSPGTSDKPSEDAASVGVVELKCVPSASDLNPPLTSVNNELGVVGTKCAPANMDKTSDTQAEQHSSIEPSEMTAGTSPSSDVMNLREQRSIHPSPPHSIVLLIVTCFICPSPILYILTDEWFSRAPLFL